MGADVAHVGAPTQFGPPFALKMASKAFYSVVHCCIVTMTPNITRSGVL